MGNLPSCSVTYPTCGACYEETAHDGDDFYCGPCGLTYGDGGENEAEFIEPQDDPCARPCTNPHHEAHNIRANLSFNCEPCKLPAGHTSDCWTDCTPYELENTDG